MGLDDLFDFDGHKRHRDHRGYDHHDDREHHDGGHSMDFRPILLAHRRLFALAAVVLLLVFVGIGFLVLPWLWQGLPYVSEHGLQGVVERIWKGRSL
jgi:hypothetical protein